MKYLLMFLFAINLSLVQGAYAQTAAPVVAKQQAVTQSTPVNINAADAKTLQTIKGLGRKKVEAILEYRKKNGNFKSLDELTNVRGISDKLLQKIKDKLSVK